MKCSLQVAVVWLLEIFLTCAQFSVKVYINHSVQKTLDVSYDLHTLHPFCVNACCIRRSVGFESSIRL